jgi:hypothetical protein
MNQPIHAANQLFVKWDRMIDGVRRTDYVCQRSQAAFVAPVCRSQEHPRINLLAMHGDDRNYRATLCATLI